MFDKISGNIAYWLHKRGHISESQFTIVDYVIGMTLFAIFTTGSFLLGSYLLGDMMRGIRIMIIFNTVLNILNYKLNFHARNMSNCWRITGASLLILFILSSVGTYIGLGREIIIFEVVTTIVYVKLFLSLNGMKFVRMIEDLVFKTKDKMD